MKAFQMFTKTFKTTKARVVVARERCRTNVIQFDASPTKITTTVLFLKKGPFALL